MSFEYSIPFLPTMLFRKEFTVTGLKHHQPSSELIPMPRIMHPRLSRSTIPADPTDNGNPRRSDPRRLRGNLRPAGVLTAPVRSSRGAVMNRSLRSFAKSATALLALCVLVANSSSALAEFRAWSTLGSGDFNNPNNWLPAGVPDVNDFVAFETGSGNPYTVTFPGPQSAPSATANYTTSHLRVRDNGVTFAGSGGFLDGPSAYTVASTTQAEFGRGIVIGLSSGENVVLNIKNPGIFDPCCGRLSSFSGVAATIGDAVGATGTLNMNTGAFNITGSDFNAPPQLIVGNHGTGTLNINSGADMNVTGHNSNVSLGHHATGVGAVTISGTGSTWTNNDRLWVGELGTGTLTIQNGGSLVTLGAAGSGSILGTFVGGTGMATVTGAGSTWTSSNELRVGNSGNGTLMISDGGALIHDNAFAPTTIGGGFNASGTATVTGAGSIWNTNGPFSVGGTSGPGTLAIQAGASLTSANGGIGDISGTGQVVVAGAGSTWAVTTGPLTIGHSGGPSISGTLIIKGGAVSVAQDIDLNASGVLQFQGGSLTAAEIGLNNLQFPGQFQWTGGTLHVETFRGDLTNKFGRLAPGKSAGATTIEGLYIQQAAGALEIEIGGTAAGTQHDRVDVTGVATLGGEMQLALIDGFVPTAQQTFTVFAASNISGAFSNVTSGQRLTTDDGMGSFLVHYGPTSTLDPNTIRLTNFERIFMAGDYNGNGIVDAADYTVWRDGLGSTYAPTHYDEWKSNFGRTSGSGAFTSDTVPEPATVVLFGVALVGLGVASRRRIRRNVMTA